MRFLEQPLPTVLPSEALLGAAREEDPREIGEPADRGCRCSGQAPGEPRRGSSRPEDRMSEARCKRIPGWSVLLPALVLTLWPLPAAAQGAGAEEWSTESEAEAAPARAGAGQRREQPSASTAAPLPRDTAAQQRRTSKEEEGLGITPAMPIPMAASAAPSTDGSAGRSIDLATPPPELGAAEFDPSATGLIRTGTFEMPAEQPEGATVEILSTAYQGVVPGQRDALPTFQPFTRAHRPYVTWVGFQQVGGGRVFVQLTQPAPFNLVQLRADEYRLEIQGARFAFRNAARRLDVSYFPGNVASVESRHRGNGVHVLIKLKKPGTPSVRQQREYLYVDLP